jgi:peptidoglycan/LPS O-acetylase OafA/YrhL
VNEIKALTSLRGIAAMMVVMQHFSATAERHAAVSIPSLVPHGYMAVDLFFVLSGFIMAYTYAADFALRGVRAMPSFLLKRAARILPLNTVVVCGIVVAGMLSVRLLGSNIFYVSTDLPVDIICNLLLLQGLDIGLNLNGPSWSISTEFAAYLLFPALLALAFSRHRVVGAGTVVICFAALVVTATGHSRLGLNVGSVGGELTLCFAQFVLGLFIFRVTRIPAVRTRLGNDWPAWLVAGWTAAALLLRIDLLAAIGFPLVVAALACNRGRVAELMATPVVYFLGEVSFSIYLVHDACRPVALAVLRSLHPVPLGAFPALGFALMASLAVVPLAWVAYVTVERPGRRVIRRLAAAFIVERELPGGSTRC